MRKIGWPPGSMGLDPGSLSMGVSERPANIMLGGDMSFPKTIKTSVVAVTDWEGPGAGHADLKCWGLGHARQPIQGNGGSQEVPLDR